MIMTIYSPLNSLFSDSDSTCLYIDNLALGPINQETL
jgi:hypothetical protein